MTSKNNPARRQGRPNEKEYQNKKVKPVLYVGSFVGHGRYVAAQDEGGKLVMDAHGKPIPYKQI
jgi:hypothetical protein